MTSPRHRHVMTSMNQAEDMIESKRSGRMCAYGMCHRQSPKFYVPDGVGVFGGHYVCGGHANEVGPERVMSNDPSLAGGGERA